MKKVDYDEVQHMYNLIIDDDECLSGSQWGDMYLSDYDTPNSIITQFINIFINTMFVYHDNDDNEKIIADYTERKIALAKYFRKIANELEVEKW